MHRRTLDVFMVECAAATTLRRLKVNLGLFCLNSGDILAMMVDWRQY